MNCRCINHHTVYKTNVIRCKYVHKAAIDKTVMDKTARGETMVDEPSLGKTVVEEPALTLGLYKMISLN